jgi:putative sterol carrier protein
VAYEAFSEAWTDAWAEAIRASDEYRQAARRWEWTVLLVMRTGPDGSGDRYAWLDLYRGECRHARPGTGADIATADFVLAADAAAWQDVLEGRLDPLAGIARGRVRLERGSMTTLAMHTAAAKALVRTAAAVETRFPGDPS